MVQQKEIVYVCVVWRSVDERQREREKANVAKLSQLVDLCVGDIKILLLHLLCKLKEGKKGRKAIPVLRGLAREKEIWEVSGLSHRNGMH